MARLLQKYEKNSFFGIGILNNINELNIGSLWRSAYILGASFIFTIDKKYKSQSSDVTKAWTKIPLYHYNYFEDFFNNIPFSTVLVAVEQSGNATPISEFKHPIRAIYLLGNEQNGLPKSILDKCHQIIQLPGSFSLNVANAGSIVLYDRHVKLGGVLPKKL